MKVPHDPLDGLTMRRTWQRLKARTQIDRELDVWSHRRQVQQ
jgi:hypothetical protein